MAINPIPNLAGLSAKTAVSDLDRLLLTDIDAGGEQKSTTFKSIRDSIFSGSTIIVNSLADFPAPTDGKIALEDGKRYILNAPILNPYTLVVPFAGSIWMTSTAPFKFTYAYVGGGNAIEGLYFGGFLATEILFAAPYGTLFNLTGIGFSNPAQSSIVLMSNVILTNIATLGRIDSASFYLIDCNVSDFGNGLQVQADSVSLSNTSMFHVRDVTHDIAITLDGTTNAATYTDADKIFDSDKFFLKTTGSLPAELNTSTTYYAVNANTSSKTFQIALTRGGAAINFTGSGTGTHYFSESPVFLTIYDNPATGIAGLGGGFTLVNSSFVCEPYTCTALDINPDVVAGKLLSVVRVSGCGFETYRGLLNNHIFTESSLTQATELFKFVGNRGLPDSTITSAMKYAGAPYAVITTHAQNSKNLILMSGWASENLERIISHATGYIAYIGNEMEQVAIDGNVLTSQSTGTNVIFEIGVVSIFRSLGQRVVTFSTGTNLVNETATPQANGNIVCFKNTAGTLPTGLFSTCLYYVVNKTTDAFQLSYTPGGTAVAFSTIGSGTNSYESAETHGALATATVDSTTKPVDIIPQAIVTIDTTDEIMLYVSNTTGTADTHVHRAYYRTKK